MTKIDRIARLSERLAKNSTADESAHVLSVVRGEQPVRAGMAVEVERATGNKRAPNGESYHVRIKASTESIARDSGIIPMSAWEKGGLRNFTDNPIILAYHDHKQPIGRSVHTELDGKSMVQYWEFHLESEVSRMMQKLYEKGFMRAASVGFLVEEFTFIDELDEKSMEQLVEQYGAKAVRDIYWIATRAELLETSAVPVPSDPNALTFDFAARNAEAVGIDISSLRTINTSTGATMTEADKAAAAAAEAERAKAANVAATSETSELRKLVEDGFKAVNEAINSLRTVVEKAAPAPAPAAVVAPAAERQDGVELAIEKLAGETDEQAVARFVGELVAQRTGAPVPSGK